MVREPHYFSTHGCSWAFCSLVMFLEEDVPFAALAAAARALLSKKLAMVHKGESLLN